MVDRNAVGPLLDQQDISIASFYEFDVTSWVQEMVADGAAEISFSIQDRDAFKDDSDICYYHTTYGEQAIKCKPGCQWVTGNGSAAGD